MANWLDRAELLLSRLPIKNRQTHRMVPFSLYRNQKILIEKAKEQWDREGKLRIIILKARRVGMSSLVDGLLWCYGMAFPNKNIKILSHLSTTSDELFRVPSDLARAFPGFEKDDIQKKRIFFRHPQGDSSITLATAGTPEAGRGGTLSALHLSEAAKYPAAEIFTSMITSVAKGEESIIVIESTANGTEGVGQPFFEYWENAEKGLNGYIPIYLSWLDDADCVLPEENAADAPADEIEEELMAEPYNATKSQIAFRRVTQSSECRGLDNVWLEEYPHSPNVAFQVSGQPAFARNELAYAERTIRDPICRGEFYRVGGSFKFRKRDNGPWHIWKFPFDKNGKSDNLTYYGGADAALGTDEGDFAAICMLCGQTGELAARFAERIPPEELANQMDMAGRWYNRAMMNPELTGNLGRWALVKLRDIYRYPNIYQWKGRDDHKRGKSASKSLGFEMTGATRALIVDSTRDGLRMAMRDEPGGLIVYDRALMSQISRCSVKDHFRWEVERGHDDIAVAFFISCLTRAQYPPPRMNFMPRNTMEPQSPIEQVGQLGVKVSKNPELDALFVQEMRKVRAAAGINKEMKGVGRRSINRLYGI